MIKFFEDTALVEAVIQQVNAGALWLEKDLGTHEGEQLWSNVCREVTLKNKGSCLLTHVNAGQIENPNDWVQAWRDAMNFACSVFEVGAVKAAGIYRDPQEDRQVAVGVTGLANYLAIQLISYQDFVEAFERFLDGDLILLNSKAEFNVWYLACGVMDAADIARSHGMRAAFTLAPTESCSFKYKDLLGFTLAPNVDAPVAIPGSGMVRRNSEAVGDKIYYHGAVETAESVGADLHFRHRVCWQRLFDRTGLAHSQSFDLWKNWDVNDLKQWWDSPMRTTYYRRLILVDYLQKGRKIRTAKNWCADDVCVSCGD